MNICWTPEIKTRLFTVKMKFDQEQTRYLFLYFPAKWAPTFLFISKNIILLHFFFEVIFI